MPRYIVRVQLREMELTHPNYGKLHRLMRSAGFAQSTLLPGGFFHLPHAEYVKTTDADTDAVLAEAVSIASKIQKKPAVVVGRTTAIRGSGLEKVPAEKVKAALSAAAKKVGLNTAVQALAKKLAAQRRATQKSN